MRTRTLIGIVGGLSIFAITDACAQEVIWQRTFNAFGPIRQSSVTLADIDGDGEEEILVGTSKRLGDAASNFEELAPAALLCLEPDGTLKWASQFPAISGTDPQTGLTYQTTSVSSTPVVGDIDGDGQLEIVVGVGADANKALDGLTVLAGTVVGQPGDLGGVYAVDAATGTIEWFSPTIDAIGGIDNKGEGRPDGVYGAPLIVDLQSDGDVEVVFGSWDRQVHVVAGATGLPKPGWPVDVADTIWSSPTAADLTGDGLPEILIGADITTNPIAETTTGGIFHVFDHQGNQNIPGFDQPVGNPAFAALKGKAERSVLWSSPVVGDLNGDGDVDIAYGGGRIPAGEGNFVRVWNRDGTSQAFLSTTGVTFSTVAISDLLGLGSNDLIATTDDGFLHVYTSDGIEVVGQKTGKINAANGNAQAISGSALTVDVDEDGELEILYPQGARLTIVDPDGSALTNVDSNTWIAEAQNTIAVGDINNDGILDIITAGIFGGNSSQRNEPTIRRFRYGTSTTNGIDFRYGRRMFREPAKVAVGEASLFSDGFEL